MICEEQDFVSQYYQMDSLDRRLNTLVTPAKEAILEFNCSMGQRMVWNHSIEMEQRARPGSGFDYWVIISGEYYIGSGEYDKESYSIPLHAVVEGKDAVLRFLMGERVRQEVEAKRLGSIKDAQAQEERRKQYMKLKEEFDPTPSTAIVPK